MRIFMMKSLPLAKLIIVLALLLPIVATTFAQDHSQQEAKAAIETVLNANAQAFEQSDLAKLEQLWSNSSDLTVFEGGYVNRGWVDYRDNHLKPEISELKNVKYSLSNIEPHIEGSTGWAIFEYTISGKTDKGVAFQGQGLGTAILEKQEGKWRIIHWHSSSKPKPKTKQ